MNQEHIFKDYIPANARVHVTYKKGENPQVDFKYPRKWTYKKAVWKCAYTNILHMWIVINYKIMKVGIPIIILYWITNMINNPYTITKTVTEVYNINELIKTIGYAVLFIIGIVSYLGIPPATITYYLQKKKERLGKWIPLIGYYSNLISNKEVHVQKFTPKNTFKKKAIIYSFSNVYLEYNTTEDYNKYLERVDIMELPYEYQRKNWVSVILKRENKNKKTKNDYEFTAIFTFSQQPKKGELTVEYI